MKVIKVFLERKFLFFAISWTVLITVLSLISTTKIPSIPFPVKDKIVHFVFYFVLTLSWFMSFKYLDFYKKIKIVCFAIVYGIIIEVLQGVFTVNREADVFDALANSLGAILAYLIFPFFKKCFEKRNIKI